MNENKLITVLTPTYNRANLLPNLYNSLIAQEENNFNWLIIDDGSTDGTKNIVSGFENDDFQFFITEKIMAENIQLLTLLCSISIRP